MNKKSVLLIGLMLVLALNITPVFACEDSSSKYIEVTKETTCERHPGYTTDPLYFELNGDKIYPTDPRWEDEDLGAIPVYPMGEKLTFWIKINVTALEDLTGVVVYDRLGGELMIDAIAYDSEDQTPDYKITYEPYAYGGDVLVGGTKEGKLDKDGVEFGDLKIYWTGNSVKAHIQWNVGDMEEGEERLLYLIVSTDTNPAGKQEYTSPGTYMLNSGATAKGDLCTGRQVSAKSNQIVIKVIEEPQECQEDSNTNSQTQSHPKTKFQQNVPKGNPLKSLKRFLIRNGR